MTQMRLKETIPLLKNDKVGVVPTDTVYGIVGLLRSPEAVRRMYELKSRDDAKPVGTILIASVDQIRDIVTEPQLLSLAEPYWPGPVSIILPVDESWEYAHKGLASLPFRVPDDISLRAFLEHTGPLATSSANIQALPPAVTLADAQKYFGDSVDFYVDGGDLSTRKPSRIIRIDTNQQVTEVRS